MCHVLCIECNVVCIMCRALRVTYHAQYSASSYCLPLCVFDAPMVCQVKLVRVEVLDQQTGTVQRKVEREVGAPPAPQFVPQFGYASLFPLLLRLIPSVSCTWCTVQDAPLLHALAVRPSGAKHRAGCPSP